VKCTPIVAKSTTLGKNLGLLDFKPQPGYSTMSNEKWRQLWEGGGSTRMISELDKCTWGKSWKHLW